MLETGSKPSFALNTDCKVHRCKTNVDPKNKERLKTRFYEKNKINFKNR